MKRFTITLVAAATILCGSAQTQWAKSLSEDRSSVKTESSIGRQDATGRQQSRKAAKKNGKAMKAKAPVRKAVSGPSADMKVIDETPAGTLTPCLKNGAAYGYSWLMGLFYQNIYGGLNNVVKSDDGKKIYLQNPLFFNYPSESNWIEGNVDGDVVTFTFPQLLDIDEYLDEEGNVEDAYYDYALRLEFIPDEDDPTDGWYYPSENQDYKFRLEADGTLTSLESEDTMIGMCAWFDGEDLEEGEEPFWSWQGNGDFFYDIKPNTNKALEVPSDVEFAEWQYLSNISSRPVYIGMKDDKVYAKGLFSSMKDAVVMGTVTDNKIDFASGQYLGEYTSGGTVVFFLGGSVHVEGPDEDGYTYKIFDIADNLTFDYDKEKNVIKSDGAYCISCAPDKVLYYVIGEKPYICIPSNDVKVSKLLTPVLSGFYDADDEYGYDAEFYFNFPTIDADKNILDTNRLFYEVIMDDEVFTFYDDEYELPEGVTETTEIPFGYESVDSYDFSAYGVEHGFVFKTRGFESLGVRTLYKADADNAIYSDILWAPGYEGTSGVKNVEAANQISAVRYFDINGSRVNRPGKGVYIMQTIYTDGSSKVRKVIGK